MATITEPQLSERGRNRTARDMAISLVVLLIPVAFVVAMFRLQGGEDVVVVDPSGAIGQARAAGAFPVTEPDGLDPRWRPVSAQFSTGESGATLRVGYLTPEGGAVQLVESNQAYEELVAREFGDQVRPAGTVMVDATRWQSLQVRGDERALVWTTAARTVIVIGRASVAELQILAAAVS